MEDERRGSGVKPILRRVKSAFEDAVVTWRAVYSINDPTEHEQLISDGGDKLADKIRMYLFRNSAGKISFGLHAVYFKDFKV